MKQGLRPHFFQCCRKENNCIWKEEASLNELCSQIIKKSIQAECCILAGEGSVSSTEEVDFKNPSKQKVYGIREDAETENTFTDRVLEEGTEMCGHHH